MFLDDRPKLQTNPFGEIWAWSFCKVGVINVSLVGGTRSLACPFLDIQSNSFQEEWNIYCQHCKREVSKSTYYSHHQQFFRQT